jgi:hypothetical protein
MIRRSIVLLPLIVASLVLVGPGSADAAEFTETFDYTGAAQSFVVPEGVCEVTLDVYGAEGADAGGEIVAGMGGRTTATIEVTPGETLEVYVGGTPTGDEILGGFNGGGDAGISTNNGSRGYGGGGASDVRQGGSALSDRVVVAGGGGGRPNGSGNGGDGGGEIGLDGTGNAPGGGGTQSAGGTAVGTGEAGSLGEGGDGGDGFNIAGGGGGGGYYGGGGASGAPQEDANFSGGGGGGSGFGPDDAAYRTGVREGDGLIDITYDDAAGTCPASSSSSTTSTTSALPAVAPRFTG